MRPFDLPNVSFSNGPGTAVSRLVPEYPYNVPRIILLREDRKRGEIDSDAHDEIPYPQRDRRRDYSPSP